MPGKADFMCRVHGEVIYEPGYYFAQYFRSIVWKKWENLLSLIKEISLIVNKFEVDCVTYKK